MSNKKYKYFNVNKVMDSDEDIVRFLDKHGKLTAEGKKNPTSLSKDELLKAYKIMRLSRRQDEYMTQLQRQGRMLTFAPNFGEEALQVATGLSLDKKRDWFLGAFRSNAVMLSLGVPVVKQMEYWNGFESGNIFPEGVNVTPIAITIGTQYSTAAGVAYALKQLKTGGIAATVVGNGGLAEGETHEAMNLAAVQEWPVLFTVNNNQWAISTPQHLESKVVPAKKACSVGIPGVRVDGNDLLASFAVMQEAVEYVREEQKPVLLEFVTWRQGVHTSSDNPRMYRSKEEEEKAEEWEPFKRIYNYLVSKKMWSEEEEKALLEEVDQTIKAAYQESLKATATVTVDNVFDHTFKDLTPELKRQKAKERAYQDKLGGK